jgi:hypothetical protein
VYVKELGRGGFGVVHLEREAKTNELRAIKKIFTYRGSKIEYKRELSILIALKGVSNIIFVTFNLSNVARGRIGQLKEKHITSIEIYLCNSSVGTRRMVVFLLLWSMLSMAT